MGEGIDEETEGEGGGGGRGVERIICCGIRLYMQCCTGVGGTGRTTPPRNVQAPLTRFLVSRGCLASGRTGLTQFDLTET